MTIVPTAKLLQNRPAVAIYGDMQHADFAESLAAIGAASNVVPVADAAIGELVVLVQCRPGTINSAIVAQLRKRAPLAGIVALVGTWCEGEPRTGRVLEGVRRVYWHEFPDWWQRQLKLRANGRCPEWALPAERYASCQFARGKGTVALQTTCRETGDSIADYLRQCSYQILWLPPNRRIAPLPSVVAGIWEGRQLDDQEAPQLADFSRRCAAPVVALLDFPRRHSVNLARQLGASIVLGKPWGNESLENALRRAICVVSNEPSARAA